jgi:hypothetical protein
MSDNSPLRAGAGVGSRSAAGASFTEFLFDHPFTMLRASPSSFPLGLY